MSTPPTQDEIAFGNLWSALRMPVGNDATRHFQRFPVINQYGIGSDQRRIGNSQSILANQRTVPVNRPRRGVKGRAIGNSERGKAEFAGRYRLADDDIASAGWRS